MLAVIRLEKDYFSVGKNMSTFSYVSMQNQCDGLLKALAHQQHSWAVQVLQHLAKDEHPVSRAGDAAA